MKALHARARERGVAPVLYWLVRAVLQPFFHLYFRLSRIGREHIPVEGPVIIAANHRSFLDPFVIGTCLRRPVYYVAKRELFRRPVVAWLLSALGAFPVDRGASDAEMVETAKAILARGDCVVMFPEGTRVRPGPLRAPRRGVGRLVLETGAPVVPVAVIGTEAVRRGWRVRPRKVRIRVGRALRFPRVESASQHLAQAVTDRVWACVELQWEWLGGVMPHRRAAVVGPGAEAAALGGALREAGLAVADVPEGADCGALRAADLVVLATPARDLPAALARHAAEIPAGATVAVASRGLVPPAGALPCDWAAERLPGRPLCVLGGTVSGAGARGGSLVVASADPVAARRLADILAAGGCDTAESADVAGVALAGAAREAAAVAAAAAAGSGAGPGVAGVAAGKVLAEVAAYASRSGAMPETLAGLAGAGGLVAAVVAPAREEASADGAEVVPLLAARLHRAHVPAPALDGLAELVAGRVAPGDWAASVTAPPRGRTRARAA